MYDVIVIGAGAISSGRRAAAELLTSQRRKGA
jgi:hypothetical protein